MTAGIAELAGRGIVAMIAAHFLSYFGVCMASPTAWVLASTLLLIVYFHIIHHDLKNLTPVQKADI